MHVSSTVRIAVSSRLTVDGSSRRSASLSVVALQASERAGADHPEPPDRGGLIGVKGPHYGVKVKGAHGNKVVTLLLESDH